MSAWSAKGEKNAINFTGGSTRDRRLAEAKKFHSNVC